MASIVTVAQLKSYSNKADGDTTREALYQTFIDAAETVVADYLGFSPASASYTHTFFGDGKPYLTLRAPVLTLTSVTVGGVSKTVSDFVIDRATITEKNGNPFPVGAVISVVYTGGYTTVPAAIILTILRIATLLTMEAGENIGVTGQSFDGGNTRTFITYTNFSKYLSMIAGLRVVRLERKTT